MDTISDFKISRGEVMVGRRSLFVVRPKNQVAAISWLKVAANFLADSMEVKDDRFINEVYHLKEKTLPESFTPGYFELLTPAQNFLSFGHHALNHSGLIVSARSKKPDNSVDDMWYCFDSVSTITCVHDDDPQKGFLLSIVGEGYSGWEFNSSGIPNGSYKDRVLENMQLHFLRKHPDNGPSMYGLWVDSL